MLKNPVKNPALAALILFPAFLTLSCPSEPEGPADYYPDLEPYSVYAYDNSEPHGPKDNRNYYTVDMVQIGTGRDCNVWVDRTVYISTQDVQSIMDKFDRSIKPLITGVFGSYTNLFTSGEGKVEIFLLDIKDNYNKEGNKSFVAGYFDARDILTNIYPYGNGAPILYIDTYPNIPASDLTYSTLAHELQHLINFCNSIKHRLVETTEEKKLLYTQDIWIDEGLSSAAEYIYRGGHDQNRIDYFNQDPLNTISKGNNFFVWGEDRPEGSTTVLDDYATVYMFFQWLRLQSGGGTGIYTAIAQSTDWDHQAVTGAAAGNFGGADAAGFSNWETLLGTWHRANYVNSSGGRDGYRGDTALKPRVWAVPGKTYDLYPGGAVYSKYTGAVPGGDSFIKFASLTRTETANNNQYPSTDTNRLLMFNVITDAYNSNGSFKTNTIKSGQLPGTGETKPASPTGRSVMETNAPYAIGVGDIRGRQGREGPVDIRGLGLEK